MYKTLSIALQSKSIKLLIPLLILGSLIAVASSNYKSIGLISWQLLSDHLSVLLLIFGLTFLNLYFEMRKWTSLVNSPLLNRKQAYSSVLVGMCSGFITPNRVGEFAGRAALLPRAVRKKASLMTFAGAGVQGAVTFLAGLIGLWYYPIMPQLKTYSEMMPALFYGVIGIGFGILLVLWFKKPLKPHIAAILKHIKSLSPLLLSKSFAWAIGRYFIFSSQFVLALYTLGFNGSIVLCYSGVFLLYFCQSYLPLTSLGELGVREVLAVLILGPFFPDPFMAALATLIVWVANIGIPVLIGLFQIKLAKQRLFGNV